MLCWVPSLFTWNYYSIVHWLYTVQNKKFLKYIYNPSLLPSLFAGNTTVIEKVLLEIWNTVITFLCSQASPVRSGVKENEEILGNEHKCAGNTGQWNYETWRANSCSNVLVFSPRSKLKGVITLIYERGHSPSVVEELVPGHPGSRGKAGAQWPGCKACLAHWVLSLQLPPEMAELAPRAPLGPQGGLSACALSPPLGPPGFLAPLLPFSLSAREPAGPGAENTDFPGNLWPSLIPDQAQLWPESPSIYKDTSREIPKVQDSGR